VVRRRSCRRRSKRARHRVSVREIHLVEGDVAQTLTHTVPETIALLRLDTDWYESTRIGLEVLYPRLAVGGVCILDDYGHWQGARKAVDDYFEALGHRPYMHTIDYSGRVFIKTDAHGGPDHA